MQKFVYDERVRKVLLGIFLFFIITLLFSNRSLRAQSPTQAPSSLPPCSKWVYLFPTESPSLGLNGTPIPKNNKDYNDPNFKTRKCIEVQTGIGQISTEPQGFVRSIFTIVLGLAGGIALILIMLSGYRFMASAGNPEAAKAAQEQLVSAIVGLLFIIFSFVILQVIGVDILHIPGFTNK